MDDFQSLTFSQHWDSGAGWAAELLTPKNTEVIIVGCSSEPATTPRYTGLSWEGGGGEAGGGRWWWRAVASRPMEMYQRGVLTHQCRLAITSSRLQA
jgi:hypothetical protein